TSYRLRFATPDGAVRSETLRPAPGETARDARRRAQDRLADLATDLRRGDWTAPAALTLGQAVADWLALRAPKLAPATVHRHRRAIRRMPKALAATRVDAVTGAQLQRAYLALAASGMAREGIRNVHKPIAAALAQQVRLGTIKTTPAAGV